MRAPQDRHLNKASKRSAATERSSDATRTDNWTVIEAEMEKNPFHRGNTAGGRKPPYKPEYAEHAKAFSERGATTEELADALGVSPKILRFWQNTQDDFNKACALTPACTDRVKRTIFDSAAAGNIAAAKYWDGNHQSEGVDTLALLLKQLSESHESRVQPKYTGPNGMMMSKKEHLELGGSDDSEIDWRKKTPEEVSQCERRLLDMRQKP